MVRMGMELGGVRYGRPVGPYYPILFHLLLFCELFLLYYIFFQNIILYQQHKIPPRGPIMYSNNILYCYFDYFSVINRMMLKSIAKHINLWEISGYVYTINF